MGELKTAENIDHVNCAKCGKPVPVPADFVEGWTWFCAECGQTVPVFGILDDLNFFDRETVIDA